MATAISYKSESGDDYLSLFSEHPSVAEIVDAERERFGEEFEFLEIVSVNSTNHQAADVIRELDEAIRQAREEGE